MPEIPAVTSDPTLATQSGTRTPGQYYQHQQALGDQVNEALKANPQFYKDPYAVSALYAQGYTQKELTSALNAALSVHGQNQSLWGGLLNTLKSFNPFRAATQPIDTGANLRGVASGVGQAAIDVAKYPVTYFQGFNQQVQTGNAIATSPRQFLQNASADVMLPAKMANYMMTTANQKGLPYAIGYFGPMLLAGGAGDARLSAAAQEGLSATDVAEAALARDRAYLNNADTMLQNTSTFDPQVMADLANAAQRVKAAENVAETTSATSYSSSFAKSAQIMDNLFSKIGESLSGLPGGVRAFNRALSNPVINAAFMAYAPIAQADNPQAWAAAEAGKVIGRDGRFTTIGDQVAETLGQYTGFFHDAIANLLNFDLTMLDDPYAAFGRVKKMTRSFSGFTGRLADMFPGMGIREAGDATRAYQAYGSVRRAVDWIATHNGAEILDRFRNTFGPGLVKALEKASTPEEVLSVLEDVAHGRELVNGTMPTMSWYGMTKAALRGELGQALGTLGNATGHDIELSESQFDAIKEQTGVDARPKNMLYMALNQAGKAKVLLRQRLAVQFTRTPMWFAEHLGKLTTREFRNGSVNAIPALMDLMRAVHIPEVVVQSFGDTLLHAVGDPQAYRSAYRQIMFETVVRPMGALMPAAEFEAAMTALEGRIWEEVNRVTGSDGAGLTGHYLATTEDAYNEIMTPSGVKRAGIGETHLGTLIMPTARQIRQLQREIGNIVMSLQHHEQMGILTKTNSSLEELKALANFSKAKIENVLKKIDTVVATRRRLGPATFEKETIHEGFIAKGSELSRRYKQWLLNDNFKGLTRAERVALVAKDIQDELVKLTEQHGQLMEGITARLNQGLDMGQIAEEMATDPDRLQGLVERLWGEKSAVEELNANMNASLNEVFGGPSAIDELAKTVGATVEEEAVARRKFVELFNRKFTARTEEVPKGLGRMNKWVYGTGKRGLRNNREMWLDLAQGYLNKWFKPMALSSPAWATRVSISEAMLNSLRMGGMNFFESHLAASIAKHTFKLARDGEIEPELRTMRQFAGNIIGGAMLGLERGLLEGLATAQKQRLMDDALALMFDEDGVVPMGVHAHNDSVTGDGIENSTLSQVWGLDKNGDAEASHMVRGENYTRILSSDAGAGTALGENLRRAADDPILQPAFQFLHIEAQQTGAATLAANEDLFRSQIYEEAVRRIESGPGAKAFAERNAFVDALRAEVQNWTEFRTVNQAERNRILDTIDKSAKNVGELTTEDFPKYLRSRYDAVNRRIARLEQAVPRIEKDIAETEKELRMIEDVLAYEPETSETASKLSLEQSAKIDDLDRQLRTLESSRTLLDLSILNHPYRNFYSVMESGAALKPYAGILSELRTAVSDKVGDIRSEVETRIKELIGDEPVVIPRGGFAELDESRQLADKMYDAEFWNKVFEAHPELWANNEAYARWIPMGMPGVEGADLMWARNLSPEQLNELVNLANYHNSLDKALSHMSSGKWNDAYKTLANLDPTTSSWLEAVGKSASEPSKAISAFDVRGVPAELIMGLNRTREKTLSDLALHLRRESAIDRPALFNKRFRPYYAPTDSGLSKFKEDFDKYQKMLKNKTASEDDKALAAQWFALFVSKDQTEWATTAKKVWDKALDSDRSRLARENGRSDYYKLLEQRKNLNAERSKIGLEKRRVLRRTSEVPSADEVLASIQEEYEKTSKRLQSLYETRESTDAKLVAEHENRDELENHVQTQDEKYRQRLSEKVADEYRNTLRRNSKSIGKAVRRIEARTATINSTIQKYANQVIDEQTTALASKSMSGENLDNLRSRLSEYVYSYLMEKSPEELSNYERALYPAVRNSTGDPVRDWANAITEHALTLTTGAKYGTFFPEIARQAATGNVESSESLARWLAEGVKSGADRPSNFPAREFVSPFAKGSRVNLLVHASDRLHSNVLGPIVNELVREPVFIWEYHTQMERLRPMIQRGWYTEDQAKVMAKSAATINMSKFVHNPMDKTVWENNMRILAPFYFAKNQAVRRALRMSENDLAAVYKYLRLNLMVTDFVGHNIQGNGTYTLPGSQFLASMPTGFTGMMMSGLGYSPSSHYSALGGGFGFDASPTSVLSMIVTGNTPGMFNVAKELIGVPWGPLVSVPAKMVYQYLFNSNPNVERWFAAIVGEQAMQSTISREIVPNPMLYGTWQTGEGINSWLHNSKSASVYGSTQNVIETEMGNELFTRFYQDAEKRHPTLAGSDLQRFGTKEAMWQFYAAQDFSAYMSKDGNFQQFLDEANWRTAGMYTLKTILSSSLPLSTSIADTFDKNTALTAIMQERGPDGKLLYPIYLLAADEYLKRYPNRPFDLVSATKPTGVSVAETDVATKVIEKHYGLFRQYPMAASFLVSQTKGKYDPQSLQIEYAMNLRQRQSPYDHLAAMNIAIGQMVYQSMRQQIITAFPTAVRPGTVTADNPGGELTYAAQHYLDNYMTTYGQQHNTDWLKYKNGGDKQNLAFRAFNEMKSALADPEFKNNFTPEQRSFYEGAIQFRKAYVEAYQAAGANTSGIRNQWYTYCQQIAANPQYAQYANFVTTVLLHLPNP